MRELKASKPPPDIPVPKSKSLYRVKLCAAAAYWLLFATLPTLKLQLPSKFVYLESLVGNSKSSKFQSPIKLSSFAFNSARVGPAKSAINIYYCIIFTVFYPFNGGKML